MEGKVPETNGEVSETRCLAVKDLFDCLEDSILDIAVAKAQLKNYGNLVKHLLKTITDST